MRQRQQVGEDGEEDGDDDRSERSHMVKGLDWELLRRVKAGEDGDGDGGHERETRKEEKDKDEELLKVIENSGDKNISITTTMISTTITRIINSSINQFFLLNHNMATGIAFKRDNN